MNPRLMAESIGPHDSFIGGYRETGELTHQTTDLVNPGGIDIRGQIKEVLAGAQRHHYLFHRRITRSLANTVNGALHLAGTRSERGQAICHRQTKVIMAVNADYRLVNIGYMLKDTCD